MRSELIFYFDFSSAYSYIAQARIDAVFADVDADIRWRPILLGAIFRENGWVPVSPGSPKGDYTFRDVERTARLAGLEFGWPKIFPFNGMLAARLFYALDSVDAVAFARAVFHAAYVSGQDVTNPAVLEGLVGDLGLDCAAVTARSELEEVKARLRDETTAAMKAGVFGAPSFVVNGEVFWGADRMTDARDWAASGGW
ncbi:2-hydroxychromene-2-carboxylate isomerase [Kordiimonas sp.]|uniref:2-hydroxychromene-2-carboxylate isomerase n=1 Tax=Kordiimonas sp. TaxID=1970157 RepID=UPI003A94A02A